MESFYSGGNVGTQPHRGKEKRANVSNEMFVQTALYKSPVMVAVCGTSPGTVQEMCKVQGGQQTNEALFVIR